MGIELANLNDLQLIELRSTAYITRRSKEEAQAIAVYRTRLDLLLVIFRLDKLPHVIQ